MSLHAPGRFSETEFCGADNFCGSCQEDSPSRLPFWKAGTSKRKGLEAGPEILATLGPQCLTSHVAYKQRLSYICCVKPQKKKTHQHSSALYVEVPTLKSSEYERTAFPSSKHRGSAHTTQTKLFLRLEATSPTLRFVSVPPPCPQHCSVMAKRKQARGLP